MSLTKEKALEILNDWVDSQIVLNPFPKGDVIVFEGRIDNMLCEYSFKYLIKIAYNLKDND